MPKLACPCGFVHNLSPIPDDGWVTIRDRDYDTLIAAEIAAASGTAEADSEFAQRTGLLYHCVECGRLMWQQPGEESFAVYRPER